MYIVVNCTQKALWIRTLVNVFCKFLKLVLKYLIIFPNNMWEGYLNKI
jgi:hypothetical protein